MRELMAAMDRWHKAKKDVDKCYEQCSSTPSYFCHDELTYLAEAEEDLGEVFKKSVREVALELLQEELKKRGIE